MYPTAPNFRSILQNGNISVQWYGSILLKNGTTKTFTMADISENSGVLTKKCSENDKIAIGTAYATEFSVQFKNSLGVNRFQLYDGIIDLYARIIHRQIIATWEDAAAYTWTELSGVTWGNLSGAGTNYDFPMGEFTIQEVMQSHDDAKIKAYDYMLKFQKEIPSPMSADRKVPYDWLLAACTACGVTLGITKAETLKMPNGNRLLDFSNANVDVKTWRDVVAEAAAVLCGNALIDRIGKLTIRRYSKYPSDGVSSGFRYSSDFSDYQCYWTGLYLSYKDGGVRDYRSNTVQSLDTGLALDLGYNSFLQITDEDTRHRAMDEIINSLSGVIYTPFKVSMPFNPAYDLMDVLEFYENQAALGDSSPITSMTIRIGGKMDISCGGENPALQEAQTKESKALETFSGNGLSNFWLVIDSAPDVNTLTITADDAVKVGEALFYAKDEISTLQVSYTATFNLLKTSLVKTEVFIDDVSIYKTQENQWPGENRLTVTTGWEVRGTGSHKVEVFLTVTESTLDVSGGGTLMQLSITENGINDAEEYGVYGFSRVTAAVPDDIGYYGGARDVTLEPENVTASYNNSDSYSSTAEEISYQSISDFYCRLSQHTGDGAVFGGRGFTRTTDSPPLLFINVQYQSGYNSYGVLSNHSEIPAYTGDYYGSLYPSGTLTVDGNIFYIYTMGGWWSSSRDDIYYTVNGSTFNFAGSACYLYIETVDNVTTGRIVAMSTAFENDCKAVLAQFAQMG